MSHSACAENCEKRQKCYRNERKYTKQRPKRQPVRYISTLNVCDDGRANREAKPKHCEFHLERLN